MARGLSSSGEGRRESSADRLERGNGTRRTGELLGSENRDAHCGTVGDEESFVGGNVLGVTILLRLGRRFRRGCEGEAMMTNWSASTANRI